MHNKFTTYEDEAAPMPILTVIIASTRPGRAGSNVTRWFIRQAEQHGGFDIDVADLAELELPFMDEPLHPRLRQYQHEHTKLWSARVEAADAFVIVMPEYNYGFTAPVKNAIDYLHEEWKYKPVGFVSYGGVSAGTRAVQMLKQVVTTLKMTPVNDAVAIPFIADVLDARGDLLPSEPLELAALMMLDELVRVESALRALRVHA
jgi:NAD(P)H-dependent FMN reductase